jgi:hypothetical protein
MIREHTPSKKKGLDQFAFKIPMVGGSMVVPPLACTFFSGSCRNLNMKKQKTDMGPSRFELEIFAV